MLSTYSNPNKFREFWLWGPVTTSRRGSSVQNIQLRMRGGQPVVFLHWGSSSIQIIRNWGPATIEPIYRRGSSIKFRLTGPATIIISWRERVLKFGFVPKKRRGTYPIFQWRWCSSNNIVCWGPVTIIYTHWYWAPTTKIWRWSSSVQDLITWRRMRYS